MECPNCKKTYDDEFNFCPWCGSEKPLIYYEDVENFEAEDELLEEENSSFEMEFKNIEEELKELEEDAIRFEENKKKEEELEIPNSDISCTHCGSRKFLHDYEKGEVVCARCGLIVYDRLLDMGPERLYNNEKSSREHLKFY